jgi:hypothetical protein
MSIPYFWNFGCQLLIALIVIGEFVKKVDFEVGWALSLDVKQEF